MDFNDQATFITIYLCEAHAQDEWPVGDKFINVPTFQQHKTLEERIIAARQFISDFDWPIPMYIDPLDDSVVHRFGAWPLRFFIVQDGKMRHLAKPTHNYTYSVDDLRLELEAILNP
eukprot:m.175599 g.175599  ORF g.175599 m.175599 type:complete len:117 (+) comp16549_c2_seq3:1120-1470(+)